MITILGWKGEVGWLAGVCWHVYMSVQSSPINQRFVILLQCLSEVWSEVHCFFAQNPASFMNNYLVKKPVDLHMYRYKIQMHSDSVCHCKHGSGDVFALLWKELWWWWVHLNSEDASMVIMDQAEPPTQYFRVAQLLWKKVIWSNYLQNLQQKSDP